MWEIKLKFMYVQTIQTFETTLFWWNVEICWKCSKSCFYLKPNFKFIHAWRDIINIYRMGSKELVYPGIC